MTKTIQGIGQVAMTVRDLDRAIAFYRDIIGLPFLFAAGPSIAFFRCGEIRLMLSTPEADGATYSSILYFRVEDINGVAETMKSKDLKFEREPHRIAEMPDHDLWMAFFRDSEGNLLALMSEVRRVS